MILGTLVGSAVAVETDWVEAGEVHAFVVGSMMMDVGSQSAVLVNVAVGLMLVTGSALEETVRTGGEVTTGAEDFETVTKVEAEVAVACSTLVGGAVDSVAGAEVAGTEVAGAEVAGAVGAVELVTEPVSTAEEDEPVTETEAEVTGLVGSSELVVLTGTPVTEPVGALVVPAGTLVGMLVGGLEAETGGSLLVELPTGTSELTLELVGIGGSVIGSEMLRPMELEVEGGTSEEVALPTSDADAVGVEVGITGGRVVGKDRVGRVVGKDKVGRIVGSDKVGRRPPFDVEAPVPESDV